MGGRKGVGSDVVSRFYFAEKYIKRARTELKRRGSDELKLAVSGRCRDKGISNGGKTRKWIGEV